MSNSDQAGQVSAYGDRLWRLQEEQRALGEDIRELKKEAKAAGVNPKEIAFYATSKRKGKEQVQDETDLRDKVLQVLGWLD